MTATGIQDTVFIIVLTDGQQSVETIKDWLEKMERTDLVQRLSDRSSGSKKKHSADEHRSALIHRVATIAAVNELLSETLNDLNDEELHEFKKFLQSIVVLKDLPDISWSSGSSADREEILGEMVRTYGRQSLELTREVFMDMKRTDLVQRLSKPSSGEKRFVDEHRPAPSDRAAAKAAVKKILLETLKGLGHIKLNKFRWLLQFTNFQRSLPQINWVLTGSHPRLVDRGGLLVHLLVETCGQQSVEVTKEVLMDMNRTDLVKLLSEASSVLEGPSRRLEHEGCGSTLQDSSDWTKLEPEVNSTDADEAPTYSLQSEAGNFECSVSGLRWVCKEKVSFKYQFCSWEEPMERMESMKYMLAGPLIDIKVNAGKLDVVFLPHWICIDDNPEIRDKFAVLHIHDCGDVVEKVAEVTSSHVKLSEPVFSPRAVLMKVGVPVKINCNMLIYKTNTAFLTLHVYLIPCDPGLQQELNRRQLSSGYRAIQKPHPEKSLKMGDRFILTADLDDAKIYPENLKLRYKSRFPNFFEVYIKKPDTDFMLSLAQKNERQPVWTREIRKDEYQSTGHKQVEHFVDKHQCDLIARVCNTGPILDNLLREGVIQQEDYDTIGTIPTTQERMRKLYSGPLKAGGQAAKDVFFRILEEKESFLVADIKRRES
ncbi:NACHT, LRR and PYD domains-containing protein 1b allele 2-like isoform X1 [Sparus aurata]|nr:NACHT, LRR and PYD domains-containing protein 1b allele 2-like isoform X1 [Sparus aurata]